MNAALNRIVLFGVLVCAWVHADESLRRDFSEPPLEWKPRPLWFWNAPPSQESTRAIMEGSKAIGYAGFGILPAQDKEGFMGGAFRDAYAFAAETAGALGMKLCLYDEYWFPSGSAGGQLAKAYPEALSKRLDKAEHEVRGPVRFEGAIPEGVLMGAVAMNTATRDRIDISAGVRDQKLTWDAPAGVWRVMLFTCVTDGSDGLVDYLEPRSVTKFATLTYDRYYERLKPYFGKVIDSAFYDEPTLYRTAEARTWTPAFNERFLAKYGCSPVVYYPAMWEDIGEDTAAARNALFGMRAELYAKGFPKVLNEWCAAHQIRLTGHHDQEEIVNPTGICGDLIKAFEYQDMPGIDQISKYDRAAKAYKIVSSAANNYGRPLVMTECYGAMDDMPVAQLYREAMDQFAKGINLMIPHAVWYDEKHITFQPELSHRTEPYASALPAYNRFVGRLQRILQQGAHVAEVGVLYPIATLQAGYHFGVGKPYTGGIIPAEADYMDVGERLSTGVRCDFTFVHPETVVNKCTVQGRQLVMDNSRNTESYTVFLMPGATTIEWAALQKLKQFHEAGGALIATTRLPHQSAELGKNEEVCAAIQAMFGVNPRTFDNAHDLRQVNGAGGTALFLANPSESALDAALTTALPERDVTFESVPALSGGHLSYIHKRLDGSDVYFIGNSSDTPLELVVRFHATGAWEEWDPHTGDIKPAQTVMVDTGGYTRLRVTLPPVQARFFICGPRPGTAAVQSDTQGKERDHETT